MGTGSASESRASEHVEECLTGASGTSKHVRECLSSPGVYRPPKAGHRELIHFWGVGGGGGGGGAGGGGGGGIAVKALPVIRPVMISYAMRCYVQIGLKYPPEAPQKAPKWTKNAPKTAPKYPKGAQERYVALICPNCPKNAPKRVQKRIPKSTKNCPPK